MATDPERGERWIGATQLAGLASIGAGAVHAAAAGIHAEHPTLSRLFVAVAAAQLVAGVVCLLRGGRLLLATTAAVNAGAVAAWLVTRLWGISWIGGLEQSEAPQFADTVCAGLGALATVAAVVALRTGRTRVTPTRWGLPAAGLGVLTVAAMMSGATHAHSHDESADHTHTDDDHAAAAAAEHTHDEKTTGTAVEGAGVDHADHTDHADHADQAEATWPRPWDPAAPIDFSGVPGVTAEQQARAEALVATTLEQLPQFADVSTLAALGFQSIGDARTGYEHFINIDYIRDDAFLDPSRPESLVYRVDGDARTLVSAMYIGKDMAIDDPELVDFGGPLMQWHVHENLCWKLDANGKPVVAGVTDAAGNCAEGTIHAGGDNPMVHVWVAPHECGPFAALEGHGAGQAAATGARADQCAHEHTDGQDAAGGSVAYDPTKPIDLSGVAGVTPEQQAFAENLVAINVIRLPQWSDPAVAEAAGFHSIGDGDSGFEHYVHWDWIDDDVWLNPDAPESLVYQLQPDGTKKLVSAMYMLPHDVALADVPDYGGALMQWHVHDNLCFTDDPVAPQVRGITRPDSTCRAPLIKHEEAPMIHVWITAHECGPFAALEGVAAGAIEEGAERWCDHAHGS